MAWPNGMCLTEGDHVTERDHATSLISVDPTPRVYLYALDAHLSASGGGRMGIGDSGLGQQEPS